MKAKKTRKLRLKYKDKKWLKEQLKHQYWELKRLNTFKTFDCSSFFRGYDLAEINRKEYDRRYQKCMWKINYYNECIKNLKG